MNTVALVKWATTLERAVTRVRALQGKADSGGGLCFTTS
jgi:hypothetical protein